MQVRNVTCANEGCNGQYHCQEGDVHREAKGDGGTAISTMKKLWAATTYEPLLLLHSIIHFGTIVCQFFFVLVYFRPFFFGIMSHLHLHDFCCYIIIYSACIMTFRSQFADHDRVPDSREELSGDPRQA